MSKINFLQALIDIKEKEYSNKIETKAPMLGTLESWFSTSLISDGSVTVDQSKGAIVQEIGTAGGGEAELRHPDVYFKPSNYAHVEIKGIIEGENIQPGTELNINFANATSNPDNYFMIDIGNNQVKVNKNGTLTETPIKTFMPNYKMQYTIFWNREKYVEVYIDGMFQGRFSPPDVDANYYLRQYLYNSSTAQTQRLRTYLYEIRYYYKS
jgi:hypothetical protein